MGNILVQMVDSNWTTQALQRACELAQQQGLNVILLRLIRVQPQALGRGWIETTPREYQTIKAYQALANDYGVELLVQPMQYTLLMDALVQAADGLDAAMIFATFPPSRVPGWSALQMRRLESQLTSQRRQLVHL